jgi:hypothetical protein
MSIPPDSAGVNRGPWIGKLITYLAGVAVDRLERAPVELVFTDPVVGRADFDDSCHRS